MKVQLFRIGYVLDVSRLHYLESKRKPSKLKELKVEIIHDNS